MADSVVATHDANTLRFLPLVAVLVDLALITANVLLYTPILRQVGSILYIAEPVALLAVYALIIWFMTDMLRPDRRATLTLATIFGVVTGTLWIINLTLETFAGLSGIAGILATAPFLLGGFVLWGIAGLTRTYQTGSLRSGLLASLWSAMLCVLVTIAYGFALLFIALPTLSANLTDDPDFLRSHWTDLHAFTLANTFDAAFSHLLGALLVSVVVGTIGALLGSLLLQLRRRRRISTLSSHE